MVLESDYRLLMFLDVEVATGSFTRHRRFAPQRILVHQKSLIVLSTMKSALIETRFSALLDVMNSKR